MAEVTDFHAHVYYDAATLEQARGLCEAARDRFGLAMGRLHERLVGPHPRWSCQLTVPAERIGPVITWLALHRHGLTLFIHPNSGDALADHRDYAIWMGELLPLRLEMFGAQTSPP